MRISAEGVACRLPLAADPSDAGTRRRPAGPGREGGLSLAGVPQRPRHDASGLYAPGKGSNYHIHSTDQISILVEAGANAGQVYGKGETERQGRETRQRRLHRLSPRKHSPIARPIWPTGRSTISSSRSQPEPGSFTPQARDVPGYTQTLRQRTRPRMAARSSSRAQTVGPITQTGPGMRIIIDGDELTEIVKGETDRGHWRSTPATSTGRTRAQRASSATTARRAIELIEFEMKVTPAGRLSSHGALRGFAGSSGAPWPASPRGRRRAWRSRHVGGARQQAAQAGRGGLGVEVARQAQPQDLRQVVIEPHRRPQHLGMLGRQQAEPPRLVEHARRSRCRGSPASSRHARAADIAR